MDRRSFFRTASSFTLPLFLEGGLGVRAFANNSDLVQNILKTNALNQDKVLVIINMNGGNDGLNTVIPMDQYSDYQNLRTNIAIPSDRVLPLDGLLETGFHPSLTGMQQLFNEGKLSIVNSVSYPNPNLSHYRANEIWMTATDSSTYSSTGWIGRMLEDSYPGYPTGYPSSQMEDPLALQIGYLTSTLLAGSQPMAVAVNNPEEFAALIGEGSSSPPDDLPCCEAGDLVAFIRKQQILSIGYAEEIKNASGAGQNQGTYPENSVADQLKIVARLVHGGLKSKVYLVTQNGYDTHGRQVETDKTTGIHATLLKDLSDSILAFQQDLKLMGIEHKVLGMTYSEFGRRANSNASFGTDHGVAAPLFLFGTGVKKQVIGTNPDLTDLTAHNGQFDLKMQVDFRQVYRDIYQDWFGIDQNKSQNLLFENFQSTFVLNNDIITIKSGDWTDPLTWNLNRIPNETDKVIILDAHKVVLYSGERAKCAFMDIKGVLDAQLGSVLETFGI